MTSSRTAAAVLAALALAAPGAARAQIRTPDATSTGGMFYRGNKLVYPYLRTFPHSVVHYYYVLGQDGRVEGALFQRAD
jgi:hypothetical protein